MEECVVCNEAITNPVCVDCVENEIATWLYEVRPGLVEELRFKTDEINLNFGDTKCILCKDHNMSVCTFCYRNHILDWLNDYPELAEVFKRYFSLEYFF